MNPYEAAPRLNHWAQDPQGLALTIVDSLSFEVVEEVSQTLVRFLMSERVRRANLRLPDLDS